MSKNLLLISAVLLSLAPSVSRADDAPLKADFTTGNAQVAYYTQGFDSSEELADWTVGDGWQLKNSKFSAIDANDKTSASIAYGAGTGSSVLESPEISVEEGSNVEFYAYFSGTFLVWGSWQFNVIDVAAEDTTQLMDAFKWAQENSYTGPNWNKFSFDVSSYAGKKVKFQFSYTFQGEDLALDGFRLTKPDASAAESIHIFEGESVTYVSTSTGEPDSYEWSFPGGTIDGADTTPATSTEATQTVTYNTAGTYDVTLTVKRGEESDTMERKAFVTVSQKAPTALIGLPEEGYESPYVGVFIPTGVPVTFRDLSTGNPTAWNWVFQNTDITSSQEQNPTVTYTKKGTCSVGLTASNAAGQSNDILQYAIQAGGAQYVWNISTEENSSLEKVALGWYGNYGGSNWLGIDRFAEKYKAPLADATVDSVAVFFASVVNVSPDYMIKVSVNAVAETGEPGDVLAIDSVKVSDLQYSDYDYLPTVIKFAEPAKIEKGKAFFVCVGPFPNSTLDVSPYTSDDIAIFCVRRGEGGKTTSWQLVEDQDDYGQSLGTSKWYENTDDPVSMAIAPVVSYDSTPTAINRVATDNMKADRTATAVYSISGQRVASMQRGGIYIVKYADGTSRKVVKK